MQAFTAWFSQLNFDRLWMLLVTAFSALVCISFHETCHGLAALALGDPTAKRAGRLSMNPLKHIDLMGLVLMVTVRFGWAKPVPVDPRYFKKPKLGMAITALAGPVSNLVLSIAALMLYAACDFYYQYTGMELLYWVETFLIYTAVLSVGLGVFNLLPIPPLDGSKILFSFLPDRVWLRLMRYERYGSLVLMCLLVLGVLDGVLTGARTAVLDWLCSFCLWPFDVLVSLYFS